MNVILKMVGEIIVTNFSLVLKCNKVPVIVVLTKADTLELLAIGKLRDEGFLFLFLFLFIVYCLLFR